MRQNSGEHTRYRWDLTRLWIRLTCHVNKIPCDAFWNERHARDLLTYDCNWHCDLTRLACIKLEKKMCNIELLSLSLSLSWTRMFFFDDLFNVELWSLEELGTSFQEFSVLSSQTTFFFPIFSLFFTTLTRMIKVHEENNRRSNDTRCTWVIRHFWLRSSSDCHLPILPQLVSNRSNAGPC